MQASSPKGLRIGGFFASDIAAWGDLEYETAWPGGLDSITWSMDPTADLRIPKLRLGTLVQLLDGPISMGWATVDESDPDEGTFKAIGLHRSAEHFLALDGAGNTTSVPNTAIDQAIARGLPWLERAIGFSAKAFTGEGTTDGANYLSTLLDAFADARGIRWYVDASRRVTAAVDPTAPTWALAPGVTPPGRSTQSLATSLLGRYSTATGYKTVTATDPITAAIYRPHEEPVDLTAYGRLSTAGAQARINNLLKKGRTTPGATQSIEASAADLSSIDGGPADLSAVQAGQMVRSYGVRGDLPGSSVGTVDWVIGRTRYTDGADSITLEPLGMEPQDFAAIIAATPQRRGYKA